MAVQRPALVYPVTAFVAIIDLVVRNVPAVRGLGVSSWQRSRSQSLELAELGRGVGARSLHELGLAMDLVGTGAQIEAFRAAWVGLGLDAVPEADHLHIELDGPLLRSLGIDFRR